MIRASNEIVDFIASGTTSEAVARFCASEDSKNRIDELMAREKASEITPEERSELDHYVEIEHIMRLAKAKARKLTK